MGELAAVGGLDPADHLAREPVHPLQPVQAVTNEHGVHCRGRHGEVSGVASWAELAAPAEPDDALLELAAGLARRPTRSTRSIGERDVTAFEPPVPPFRRGLA